MQRTIAQIHPILARLFLAGLLLQFYLAGAPMFGVASFQPHRMLGVLIAILAILLLVLSFAGHLGRQQLRLSTLLVFLVIVQVMLPALRGSVSWIAALHAVNALALVGVSIRIGRNGQAAVPQMN
jgi:hypothetical protein